MEALNIAGRKKGKPCKFPCFVVGLLACFFWAPAVPNPKADSPKPQPKGPNWVGVFSLRAPRLWRHRFFCFGPPLSPPSTGEHQYQFPKKRQVQAPSFQLPPLVGPQEARAYLSSSWSLPFGRICALLVLAHEADAAAAAQGRVEAAQEELRKWVDQTPGKRPPLKFLAQGPFSLVPFELNQQKTGAFVSHGNPLGIHLRQLRPPLETCPVPVPPHFVRRFFFGLRIPFKTQPTPPMEIHRDAGHLRLLEGGTTLLNRIPDPQI